MYHMPPPKKKNTPLTVKIKGKKKSECPSKVTVAPVKLGQHRGRFSLFWSSRTWTGRRNTFRRSSSLCVRRAAASTGSVHSHAPDARLNQPPGRSLVQSCAAGTRPGVSGDP
ncbi:hypothetical protein XENORESO_008470 [Xenotaenia resolanae]|uniref:Uncharacterized protein n=1 Tax=Xenotaenia resolanae TaxID=208358 RepID=A0ABV0WN87_9TELE